MNYFSEVVALFLVLISFLAGIACKKVKRFPHNTSLVLNAFVVQLSLPALILAQFPYFLTQHRPDSSWLVPVSMAWISFFLSALLFGSLGRKFQWNPKITGALILTAGLGNTSFVGLPLLEAMLGKNAMPIGILVDQPGSFLVLSTLGVATALYFSGKRARPAELLKRVATFPPFLALIFSFVYFGLGRPGSDILQMPLERLGGTLVPVALFAVGFQTSFNRDILRSRLKYLAAGLAIKLVAMPIFFAFFYYGVVRATGLTAHVTVLESAMATMITSAVVANECGLDPELANLMVSASIPLSLVTVPMLHQLLLRFSF